jgi:hypothetical protein
MRSTYIYVLRINGYFTKYGSDGMLKTVQVANKVADLVHRPTFMKEVR